ncbi:MAG: hypothetical protein ACR2OA_01280 [Rubripirellula sp.]
MTISIRAAAGDPAFVVADKDAADQRSLAVSLVRFRQRDRAVGSAATVLRQSLRQTQDSVLRVDADVVRLRVERNHDAVRIATQDRCREQCRNIHATHLGRSKPPQSERADSQWDRPEIKLAFLNCKLGLVRSRVHRTQFDGSLSDRSSIALRVFAKSLRRTLRESSERIERELRRNG